MHVIDINGREEKFIMPAYRDWYNGRDLMQEVARAWEIPYETVTLSVIGSEFVVDPLYTLRENGIDNGTVIQLVRSNQNLIMPVTVTNTVSETGSNPETGPESESEPDAPEPEPGPVTYGRRAGPLEPWERECCVCRKRMSHHIWAVIPACSGCYTWNKSVVDNFRRLRDQQN